MTSISERYWSNIQQICRLCLSEECLENIFKEDGLHQWIADYLSIMVSSEDRMSQAICTICRIRLIEFHQFRVRSQEVQAVLQSMLQQNHCVGQAHDEATLRKTGINGTSSSQSKSLDSHTNIQENSTHKKRNRKHDATSRSSNIKAEKRVGKFPSLAQESISLLADMECRRENLDQIGSDSPTSFAAFVTVPCDVIRGNVADNISNRNCEVIDIIDIEDVKIENSFHDVVKLPTHSGAGQDEKETEASFNCEECCKVFKRKIHLQYHNKLVHGPKNFKCYICRMAFPFRKKLVRHENSKHHKEKVEEFRQKRENQKMANKISEYKETSKQQSKEFGQNQTEVIQEVSSTIADDSVSPKQIAIQVNEDGKYACSKCDRTFSRQCRLRTHMDSHEVSKEAIAFSDSEDLVDIPTLNSNNPTDQQCLAKEIKTDKQWMCDHCQTLYPTEKQLVRHKSYHQKKGKDICPICNKLCSTRQTLKRHILTHDESRKLLEKPFKCELCPKAFLLNDDLKHHHIQVHGPRIHCCQLCDSKFRTRKHLLQHVQAHNRTGGLRYGGLQSLKQNRRKININGFEIRFKLGGTA